MFNVTWESPTFDSGGGPITAFQTQVRIEQGGWRNCTTSSETRNCLFKGLVNEAEYHVRIQAINRKGPSDWSDASFVADYTGILVATVATVLVKLKSNHHPDDQDKRKQVNISLLS